MNESKKLKLSKETLRCLDDEDLTGVAGGWGGGGGGGGGSNNCNNSNNCGNTGGLIGVCDSVVCGSGLLCIVL